MIQRLRSLRVMTKLVLAAVLSTAIYSAAGGFAFQNMKSMAGAANQMYLGTSAPLVDVNTVTALFFEIRESVIRHIIAPPAAKQTIIEQIRRDELTLERTIQRYEARPEITQGERVIIQQFTSAWLKYVRASENTLLASVANNRAEAEAMAFEGSGGQTYEEARTALNELARLLEVMAAAHSTDIADQADRSQVALAIGVVVTLAVALGLNTLLARSIARPLGMVAAAADQLAQGDLTGPRLSVFAEDEVGQMTAAFNHMKSSLSSLLRGVSDSTQAVMSASSGLSEAALQLDEGSQEAARLVDQVAAGATQQAGAATDVHRNMEGLQEAIRQIAENAGQSSVEMQRAASLLTEADHELDLAASQADLVAQRATMLTETTRHGAVVVEETLSAMAHIRQAVGLSGGRMRELEELLAQIGVITEAISAIADQTKLLALNAAIEAARAGEHGRGFAVVADEVRKLADGSARSAGEIEVLVRNIQLRTTESVEAIATGDRVVQQGSELAGKAGDALEEILTTLKQTATDVTAVAQRVGQVRQKTGDVVQVFETVAAAFEEHAAATEEMAASTTETSGAVERIDLVAQQNAATGTALAGIVEGLADSTGQVASSAGDLAQVADQLQRQVAHFRVNPEAEMTGR